MNNPWEEDGRVGREHMLEDKIDTGSVREDERRSYWRELSEDQLLEIQFTTNDPESLAGMSDDPPPRGLEPRVELAYDVSGREKGKVRCVHCKFPNHNRGFVLLYPDGQRRTCGRDCGKKLYGADFDRFLKDFDAARDLAGYLRRRRAALAARHVLLDGLSALRTHPSLAAFAEMRRRFRRAMPALTPTLAALALAGGRLAVEEQIRNHAAEERRESRMGPMTKTERKRFKREGKLDAIYDNVERELGTLAGIPFFLLDEPPSKGLEEAQARIAAAFQDLEQSEASTAKLRNAFRAIQEGIDCVQVEVGKLASAIDAFEAVNLRAIAEWANARKAPSDRSRYQAGIGLLRRSDDEGDHDAKFTVGYQAPDARFLAAYKVAAES